MDYWIGRLDNKSIVIGPVYLGCKYEAIGVGVGGGRITSKDESMGPHRCLSRVLELRLI